MLEGDLGLKQKEWDKCQTKMEKDARKMDSSGHAQGRWYKTSMQSSWRSEEPATTSTSHPACAGFNKFNNPCYT